MKFNNTIYIFWVIYIFLNFKNISEGSYNQPPSGYTTDNVYILHTI